MKFDVFSLLVTINWPLVVCVLALAFFLKLTNCFFLNPFSLKNYLHRKELFNKIPGPRGSFLFGNALSINRTKPYVSFEAWAKQYGPVYTVKIFNTNILVLSSVETIHEALVQKSVDFSGRPPQFYRATFMADGHMDIVSASPCESWSLLKKAVVREVKKYDPSTLKLEELTMCVIDDLLKELKQSAGELYNPREVFFTGIVNTNCMLLIGDKLSKDDKILSMMKEMVVLVTRAMNMGGRGSELDIFPWLRFLGNSTYKELLRAKKIRDELYDWMKDKIEYDIKNETEIHGVMHGFQNLLQTQKDDLNETNVKLAIVNLIIGGTSVSHHYLYLLIHVLAQNPDIQECLYEEINSYVGDSRRPSKADTENMHYAKALILEIFRFGSISPILIPHFTTTETSIANFRIPANTTVLVIPRYVHHDPTFWPDPYRFDPTRFLQQETGKLLSPSHSHLKHLISFGGGVRGCPGETFAKSRLFLFLTHIVQQFRVQADAECPLHPCDPNDFGLGLVLSPKDFKVRFIPRTQKTA